MLKTAKRLLLGVTFLMACGCGDGGTTVQTITKAPDVVADVVGTVAIGHSVLLSPIKSGTTNKITIITPAQFGTTQVVDSAINYTAGQKTGVDSFLIDVNGTKSTAVVIITDTSIANNDIVLASSAGTPTEIDVFKGFNYSGIVKITKQPNNGTANVVNNKIVFTAFTGYSGVDFLSYSVDGGASKNLIIGVVRVSTIAVADSYDVYTGSTNSFFVTMNDLNVINKSMIITEQPQNGTVEVVYELNSGFPYIVYTAKSGVTEQIMDTFKYSIDGSDPTTVTVKILPAP